MNSRAHFYTLQCSAAHTCAFSPLFAGHYHFVQCAFNLKFNVQCDGVQHCAVSLMHICAFLIFQCTFSKIAWRGLWPTVPECIFTSLVQSCWTVPGGGWCRAGWFLNPPLAPLANQGFFQEWTINKNTKQCSQYIYDVTREGILTPRTHLSSCCVTKKINMHHLSGWHILSAWMAWNTKSNRSKGPRARGPLGSDF